MGRRVIVTRPAHDAQDWVAKLTEQGVAAEALPLIEIAAVSKLEDVAALTQAVGALSHYTACMFVSANAVTHFFSRFPEEKTPTAQLNRAQAAPDNIANKFSTLIRFLAPGPSTAAALLAAGVPADQIDAPPADAAQFDSEALWQVIGQRDWRGASVLIVRGKGDALDSSAGTGRDWLMQQWQAGGCRVDVVSCYQRCAPKLSGAQLALARAASCDGSVWLFSSSEAVANLVNQPSLVGLTWQNARAIATHPRIQATALAAGWGVVHVSRPPLIDIISALRSIELHEP